ncbi:MAG TPA: dihydrolipoamide acetyltransferase family protein [Polyangiaceae bacterium]|nr:dihydrolipoamide acetyltransferase family protein [Polyangiaceae bacterium]
MSRFEFKLPDIGEGVTEGEIVSWLVAAGDSVTENQDMVEVMTDKATVTIGAPKNGKIVEVRGSVGDVVPVGSVLVVLDVDGEASARKSGPPSQKPAPAAAPEPKADGGGTVASAVGDLKDVLPGLPNAPRIVQDDYRNEKPLASPATRKLARELGVDLQTVRPTGDAGRVTREDVERKAAAAKAPGLVPVAPGSAPAPIHSAQTVRPSPGEPGAAPRPAPRPAEPPPPARGDQRVPIRGLRKRIYENMARAKHTAAHFTYVDECNVTALRGVRERGKVLAEAEGISLQYLPFIVKAVVAALRRHPTLNAVVDDAAMEIVQRGSYDIGIAVATDSGLTVPVLRGADRLSILEISREIDRLASEARAGKTRREDLGGSSFTITSLGRQGGLFATPVVNYPEVAILGVHQIKKRPVVQGDEIVIGDVMLLSLSFDHRIIDGHVGAAFAAEVIGYLETPEKLLLEMR